jgi:hypothetical protein
MYNQRIKSRLHPKLEILILSRIKIGSNEKFHILLKKLIEALSIFCTTKLDVKEFEANKVGPRK